MTSDTIISVFLGIGLAASVGFRVFLPLFALSLVSYFDIWELNENWQWIGGSLALLTLGVATIVEVLAYYMPYVDNVLDTIAVPLAAVAGTAVMVLVIIDLNPLITWALAIIAGGGTAATVSGSSSATRLTSTASTAGFANPVISTLETVAALIMTIVSLLLPVLGFICVLVIMYIIFKVFKKIRPR